MDNVWIKHWEYKSWITLSCWVWKSKSHINRFVLKNTFIKLYIYHFLINIFIKTRSQSNTLETVLLSKTILFLSMEGVYGMLAPMVAGYFLFKYLGLPDLAYPKSRVALLTWYTRISLYVDEKYCSLTHRFLQISLNFS